MIPGARPGALATAVFLLGAAGGCSKDGTTGGSLSVCGKNKPCGSGKICVLRPRLSWGSCAIPCSRDGDCPGKTRCSGRFRSDTQGKLQGYCRRAVVPAGGDCSGLRDGCQTGLQCRYGRTCVRSCEGDGDCGSDERCQPIHDRRTFGGPRLLLYRACVKATLKDGQTCVPDRVPLCGRGLRCHRNRCLTECRDDASCGPGRVCDGQGAPVGDAPGGSDGAFRYCRKAAGPHERCGRSWHRDVGCGEGLVCYRGRCRPGCQSHADCRDVGGKRRRRCLRRRLRDGFLKLCL